MVSPLPSSNDHAVALAGADISPAIRTDHDSESWTPTSSATMLIKAPPQTRTWMETLRFLLLF